MESVAIACEVLYAITKEEGFRIALQASVSPVQYSLNNCKNQIEIDENYSKAFKDRYLNHFLYYIDEELEKTEITKPTPNILQNMKSITETSYAEKENKVLRAIYEMGKGQPEVWVLIDDLSKALEMPSQELYPILNDLEDRKGWIGSVDAAVWMIPAGIEVLEAQPAAQQTNNMEAEIDKRKVFVVHGHDDGAKEAVARFLKNLDLEPVILHEQPNAGKTIIEKFEHYSNVGFAVVLLTPDDAGAVKGSKYKPVSRARQNVVFELGYFFAKLKREKVCALYKEGVELPSDMHGVLYTLMDERGAWRTELAKEMKHAGLTVDMNKI